MRKEYLPRPSGIPGTNNPRRVYSSSSIEIDLARSSDQFRCFQIPEPNLIFGRQGTCSDPKTGLALYGPYGVPSQADNPQIRVGIVGTSEGIGYALGLLQELSGPIEQNENVDCMLHPSFPGLNSLGPSGVRLITQRDWHGHLNEAKVCSLKELENFDARALKIQEMFGDEVRAIGALPDPPDAILCVLPGAITSFMEIDTASATADPASMDENLPGAPARSSDRFFRRFRSGFKAACMGTLPTELIWHKMDSMGEGSGDRASSAWDLSLALTKKAGVISWRLPNTSEVSCFIGISSYEDSQGTSLRVQRSFAHVLTERGDSFIVPAATNDCHAEGKIDESPNLNAEQAGKLLTRALSVFEKYTGFSPRRVTVHKATEYTEAERQGFERALSKVPDFGLMTISQGGIAFIRPGRQPVLRGTAIPFDEKTGLVATSGYVPFLRGSFGNELPNPLAISENWGSITFLQAAEDLIRLTKLDLASSGFCSELPFTLSRSAEIGDVLRALGRRDASAGGNFYV